MITEEIAAKLTAYALGEGTPEERREAEALIAKDPEARKFVDEIGGVSQQLARELGQESLPDESGTPMHPRIARRRRVLEYTAIFCLVLVIAYLPFRKKIAHWANQPGGAERATVVETTVDEKPAPQPDKGAGPSFHQVAWINFKNQRGKPQFAMTDRGYLIEATSADQNLKEEARQKLSKCVPADNYRDSKAVFSAIAVSELSAGHASLRMKVVIGRTAGLAKESNKISGIQATPQFLAVEDTIAHNASDICVEAVLSPHALGKVWFDQVEFTAKPLSLPVGLRIETRLFWAAFAP